MSDRVLDLGPSIGQRTESFEFQLIDGGTGRPLGEIHPINAAPALDHAGGAVVTRTLALDFDTTEAAEINPVSDRVEVFMHLGGRRWPLGQFLFTDPIRQDWAGYSADGLRSALSGPLADRMTIVDTELEHAFGADAEAADDVIRRLLADLDLETSIAGSASPMTNTWTAGTTRLNVLGTVASFGGYLAPWVDHGGVLQAIRLFEPALAVPDFDWDANDVVIRETVTRADSLSDTPNRIVVVANGGQVQDAPVVAYCDVPSTAPHSIPNLGFVRPRVFEAQVSSLAQANQLAENLCLTQTAAETLQLSTVLDPRHEAHQVVKFEGQLWLELAWSMELAAGGLMHHTLQRTYRPTDTAAVPATFTG